MHKVVETVQKSLSEIVSDYDSKSFVLAVSAGIDSMALLNACVTLRLNFEVAHCNYHLRGYESDDDQQFIEKYCEDLAIPIRVKEFNVELEKQKGESVQMTARRLRFDWFNQLIEQNEYDFLLLAHHLDDQIESFFINFFRGTGIKGMAGIRKLNGNRLRPMLELTKNDIEQYANYLEMEYREDSSNSDYKYVRNKIRHHLIPLLKELRPEIHDVFLKNNRKMAIAQEALDWSFNDQFSEIDEKAMDKNWFFQVQGYYQYAFLERFGFNSTQLHNLQTAGVGTIFESDSHQIFVNRDNLEIHPIEKKEEVQYKLTSIQNLESNEISLLIEERVGSIIENSSKNKISVSKSEIVFPLVLRKWAAGDSFVPLGMKGSKKLSDFFIDEKLDQTEKRAQWLLVNGDSRIIWVLGRRLSNEFKVTNETKLSVIFETK